jgi:hypothetical protein
MPSRESPIQNLRTENMSEESCLIKLRMNEELKCAAANLVNQLISVGKLHVIVLIKHSKHALKIIELCKAAFLNHKIPHEATKIMPVSF